MERSHHRPGLVKKHKYTFDFIASKFSGFLVILIQFSFSSFESSSNVD